MNIKLNLTISLLIVFSFIISACGPVSSETPYEDPIQIASIDEGPISSASITQVKIFDQCQSASPLKAEITFSETLNKESEEGLMLGGSLGGSVGVSKLAEIEIKGEIQKHFSEKTGQSQEHAENIQIEVPPYTKQEYTIIWNEYREQGTVDYIENGKELSVGFDYRIGVEFSSSSVVDLSCTTSTPINTLPGGDWQQSCISTNWTIYPVSQTTVDESGCYQQPIWDSISTRDNGLYILAQPENMIAAKEYGLFVQLPQSGTVRLNMDLEVIDNGEVWFGIFSEPNLKSDGLLIVAPPGNVTEHVFAVRTMPDQKQVDLTKIYTDHAGIYSAGFDLFLGSVNAVIQNTPRSVFAFSSTQRWLFIGYRAKLELKKGTANIEALINDLVIKPQ